MPTTRELALIIVSLLFVLCFANDRKTMLYSFWPVFKQFISLFRLVYFQVLLIYTVFLTWILIKLGFLEWGMTTNYLIVTLFSIVPLVIRNTLSYTESDWRKDSLTLIKLTVIPIFIITNYTMSFGWELLLCVFSVVSTSVYTYAKYKNQHTDEDLQGVEKVSFALLSIIGLIYIVHGFYDVSNNLEDLQKASFWKTIALGFTVFLYYPLITFMKKYQAELNVLQFPRKKKTS